MHSRALHHHIIAGEIVECAGLQHVKGSESQQRCWLTADAGPFVKKMLLSGFLRESSWAARSLDSACMVRCQHDHV
jgi:hypothetical protein